MKPQFLDKKNCFIVIETLGSGKAKMRRMGVVWYVYTCSFHTNH